MSTVACVASSASICARMAPAPNALAAAVIARVAPLMEVVSETVKELLQ